MNDFGFKFCLNNSIEQEIKSLCEKNKKIYNLKIKNDNFIEIKFRQQKDHKYLKIRYCDVGKFLNLIKRNFRYLYCKNQNHSCKFNKYNDLYLNYLIMNNNPKNIISWLNFNLPNMAVLKNIMLYIFQYAHYALIKNVIKSMNIKLVEFCIQNINTVNNPTITKVLLKKHIKLIYIKKDIGNNYHELDYYIDFFLKKDIPELYILLIDVLENFLVKIKDEKPIKFILHNKKRHFIYSLYEGSMKIAEQILIENPGIIKLNTDILEDFIYSRNIKMLGFLLDKNLVDDVQLNELFKESYKHDLELVELLVMHGANVDDYGKDVIKLAKKCCNHEVIKFLHDLNN
ncbi:hypothetical protein QLL95_gp0251 [Cotonvirus japonicus]|uniref:Ankyrin repeat protein n=1 Tax=Cotonvirus japonicus TaxID=2811091 RepID=A0ABM7NRG1_9VIRU|nr:hypothetical protein QLL95_gp0251 [Cotonvirus japonicus]BCS82740.1 hypothetical protein [Cotonvirus japonicus]